MLQRVLGMFGGYAFRQRDLRLLYIAIFLSFLGASVTFPLRLLYARAHHATPAELGLMAAAFLLAPLLAQLPMGWLVDRWGRVPVFVFGLVSHTLISLLYIFFTAPLELVALRFLEGISVAAFQPSISAYIADVTPEEHRSEAYGAMSATLNAGLLIGPLVGGVIGQRFGFAAAFAINVVVEALALVVVWGRIREPRLHEARHESGAGAVSWRTFISIPLLGAYVAFFSGQIVMGMLSALWTIWIHDLGGSFIYIGATMTVFALPQIFVGAAAGRLVDRVGRAPLLLCGGILVSVVYISYGFISDLTAILVLGVVEGFFIVFQQPAAQSLLVAAVPSEVRGRAQGLAGAAGAIGGAAAAFFSLPLYHTARPLPFIMAGGAMTIGSIVAAGGALVYERRHQRAGATVSVSSVAAR